MTYQHPCQAPGRSLSGGTVHGCGMSVGMPHTGVGGYRPIGTSAGMVGGGGPVGVWGTGTRLAIGVAAGVAAGSPQTQLVWPPEGAPYAALE